MKKYKKKYLVTFLITSLFLTSCNNSDVQDKSSTVQDANSSNINVTGDNSDSNNNASTNELGVTSEIGEADFNNTPSINIITKDFNIDYLTNDDNFKDTLLNKFKSEDYIKLSEGEIIRLEFFQSPSHSLVFQSFYIKNNTVVDSSIEDIVILDKSDNLDVPVLYDTNDKEIEAVIYNVEVDFEDISNKYSFIVGIDKPINQVIEEDSNTSITGFLNTENQSLYDTYKASLDKSLLKDLEPMQIVEFFIQAHKEYDYKTAYSLVLDDTTNPNAYKKPTEEEYTNSFLELTSSQLEEFIIGLELVITGEFVAENNYISYEGKPGDLFAFDMIQEEETKIWHILYFKH